MSEFIRRTEVIRPVRTVRVIIENERGQVLLLQRPLNSNNQPLLWEFPGGKVDKTDTSELPGQTIINAGIREVREETGINLDDKNLKEVHHFDFFFQMKKNPNNWNNRRVHYLSVQLPNTPDVDISGSDDNHGAHKWVSKHELAIMLAGGKLSANSSVLKPILGDPLKV